VAHSSASVSCYGLTDTDGSRPDAWGYIATYGLQEQTGEDIERFR
jgi:hypothetical protein